MRKQFLWSRYLAVCLLALLFGTQVFGQGAAGIEQVSTELATYIDPIESMILVIGAIGGLFGAIKIYLQWNAGDRDAAKSLMTWFAGAIFLVAVGIIVRAFFGI